MCSYCRGKELEEPTAEYAAALGDYTIIIRNAPCLECVQFREMHYADEVMRNIERIVAKGLNIGFCN